ncbi:MAG TPA: Na+/H+ antiporter subunit E [Streptosporangiaceae bacterium]|nr:Na+/H+ antiporter subunit E [Streptosporangiaceae bacterium]
MTRPRPPEKVPLARRAGAWLAWWVLLMSFWVMLDDSVALDELLAGAGTAALAAFLAELVTYQAAARVRIRASWLARVITLPGQVAQDTVIVFAALWRRLAHGEEPPSGFRRRPVRYGDDTAAGRTRRALLVGAASLAPNSIAAGLDKNSGAMVIHQLVVNKGEGAE